MRSILRYLVFPPLAALCACADESGSGTQTGNPDASDGDSAGDLSLDLSPAETAPDPTWTGTWMVDQPAHALYEYTLYEFRADGALLEGTSDPPPNELGHPTPTGRVARCLERDPEGGWCSAWADLECLFGNSWSIDGDLLVIAGTCSDGSVRDIVLSGLAPTPLGPPGFVPTVENVGGETDWAHNSFDWRFVHCPDATVASCWSPDPAPLSP